MTLLSIAKDVADEVGLRRPTVVLTSTDGEVQKLYRIIRREIKDLIEAAHWRELTTEKTFTGVAGSTQTSIIPSDFNRMVPETFWDRSGQRLFTAVASAVEWQNLKAISYAGPELKFFLRGTTMTVIPDLAGGESLAYEYISNNFARAASGGAAQSSFQLDADTTVLDENLITQGAIWRYKAAEGLPYAKDEADYRTLRDTLITNNQPTSGQMLVADIFGGGRAFSGAPGANTPTHLLWS